VVAALNGWVLGGGLELALACDIRIASEKAQFGSFELRRGMHPADGGIVRLVNICGAGIALEMELTGEAIDAQRALQCNMVSRVVPHDQLMSTVDSVVASILRNDRQAVESAKETILEVIGRPLDDQLRLEALLGYAICGDNPAIRERSQEFFDKAERTPRRWPHDLPRHRTAVPRRLRPGPRGLPRLSPPFRRARDRPELRALGGGVDRRPRPVAPGG
jgi:enoyl-CoA hydratase/carnithine racemase